MPRKRKAPPYRRTVITFWNDPMVRGDGEHVPGLSLEEKAVLVYLFTNEHSHACGLYRLPAAYVLDELGLARDRMKGLFEKPLRPFATYDWGTSEVFVHRMMKHQFDGRLVGKDKRIPWVMSQLSIIQSDFLKRAFRVKYDDWNLDFSTILPDDDPDQLILDEIPEKSSTEAKREGASEAPSPPKKARKKRGAKKASDSAKREGASQGASYASPSPSPSPSKEQPPVQSSYLPEGREVVSPGIGKRNEHPLLASIWVAIERALYAPWWHGGNGPVILEGGKKVEMGLERMIANDLLTDTDDPDLVVWAIQNASQIFEWDGTSRHTLYWFKQPENLSQAEGAFHNAQAPAPEVSGLSGGGNGPESFEPTDEEQQRRAELQAQLEAVRSAPGSEPDDPLTQPEA